MINSRLRELVVFFMVDKCYLVYSLAPRVQSGMSKDCLRASKARPPASKAIPHDLMLLHTTSPLSRNQTKPSNVHYRAVH